MVKKILWSFFEILETVIIAVAVVFLVRAFVTQPFLVSGSSMEPSFENGNYLLVDELTYRFRDPERGEVVVFESPTDPGAYYIKRIIGLPGEKVVIKDGRVEVYKDGEMKVLKENYISSTDGDSNPETVLGDQEYFMMGDNRDFSFDSRNWGPLDADGIVGLVRFRLWPISEAMAVSVPEY